LFHADYSDPFTANSENSGSIGSVALGGDASHTLAQDLVGVVGWSGSTDGKPHGGDIFAGSVGAVRYSPDGSGIAFIGSSPRSNPNLYNIPSVFIGDGRTPVSSTQNAGNQLPAGIAWAPGAAIPKPDRLVLAPSPIFLSMPSTVQVLPTLFDAQGNVIARAALWRDFNGTCPTCGIRCDSAPDQIPCSGYRISEPDFTGTLIRT
jgi:hypothetical protein